MFVLAHRGLIDDAYITLDYARTLARYGQWALEPGHPANTATSPLNVVLLAVLIGLCGAPVLSVGVLLTLMLAATGAALSAICAQLGCDRRLAVAAVALLAVNPLLISTTGLETYLAVALIATLGAAVLACRPVTAGLVCGLLVLIRADLAAFGLASLIGLTARCRAGTRLQRAGQVLGVAAAVGLPWFAASWWWLGSAIPDTLLFKVSEVWEGNSFASGLWHYALGYPVATVLAVLPAAAGIVAMIGCVAAWLARTAAPVGVLAVVWALGAALHLAVYLVLRPPPYHWYYGPAIAALSMLAMLSVAELDRHAVLRGLRPVAGALAAALLAATIVFLIMRPWTVMPITSNWASASEYAALAARVPPGATVESFGEVGAVAYFCQCTIADRLSDRAPVAQLLRAKRPPEGTPLRTLFDWNYHRFRAPGPMRPTYRFAFAEDPTGIAVTSWRPYFGQMVIQSVPTGSGAR